VVRTRIAAPAAPVNSTAEITERYAHLEQYDREHLVRLDLDNRNRVIGEEIVAIGTATSAPVIPSSVFKGAMLSGAVRIMILHNHPSGDPHPSAEDRQIQHRMVELGELLGLPVMDFLILGEKGAYWSMLEDGFGPATSDSAPPS
jgi:DNA repair protein RadC